MPVTRRNPQIPDYSAQAAQQATNMAVPRPGYNGGPIEDWFANQLRTNPGYRLPEGYTVDDSGKVSRDTHSALDDFLMKGLPAIGFGAAGLGATGAFGGGADAAAAGSGEVASEGLGGPGGVLEGIGSGSGESGGGSGVGSFLGNIGSKLFGSKKLDPTSLLLGGLSLLGGPNQPNIKSYEGTGADPVNTLSEGLAGLKRLAATISSYQPTQSNLGPGTPAFVPSTGLQVGGGLATDPSMKPSLAAPPGPFDSPFGEPKATPSGPTPTGRRRPV